ncbi:hypothetical protein BS78_03G126100 [Paspalum vaginatum]|nr:hypothetical protein BS78_03G126100 [Paspalum vaginatum]
MVARLRRRSKRPPVYGVGSEEFTVEMHHGGFFVGQGSNRAYVDGKVNWFDQCELDTWSPLWLDDFAFQLHYPKTLSPKYYWLLPGKTLSDGLRIIASDIDTMDDIVANPISSLPRVISPSKDGDKLPEFYRNLKRSDHTEDDNGNWSDDGSSEEDSEFVDSDYELEMDDDNLFVDNVDEQVIDQRVAKGKKIGKGKKATSSTGSK